MSLPHIAICDCVTERTGKPHVTITRPQYEALVESLQEAMEAVRIFHGPEAWDIYEKNAPEMQRWKAALRAAGIPEDNKP